MNKSRQVIERSKYLRSLKNSLGDEPKHVGKILKETLVAHDIGQIVLSQDTGLTTKHISRLINCKENLTAKVALKLEKSLNTIKAETWLENDCKFKLYTEKKKLIGELTAELEKIKR